MTRAISLLVLCLALLPAQPAYAHAAVLSSQPEPGQRLAVAPGVVTLRFTEPLSGRLSRTEVAGPTGRIWEGGVVASQEMQVRLSTPELGIYVVRWTTVSTLDGHTLKGTFRFGVGVDPGAGEASEITLAPQPTDLLIAVARWAEYAALLMAVGMLLLRHLAARPPRLDWLRVPLAPPLAIAYVAGQAVVLGEALSAGSGPWPVALRDYLLTGLPGAARLLRLIEELAAYVMAISMPRLVGIPLALAFGALAAAGHAAAIRPAWLGIGVDAVHLVSAGLWAGGILALAMVRPPGGWRGAEGRALLARFSPVAIPAFVVTVASGAARGVQELGDPGALLATPYGQVLAAKVALVLAMVPLSVLAWRRRAARPRVEAALGALVLAAAALLAAFPLPPGRVVEAEEARGASALTVALPREGDLTLGGAAGDVLVGLTLRPGAPGPNDALVYLLPPEGERAAAGISAELVVEGRSVPTQVCASTCRSARLELGGGERLEVRLGGSTSGTAPFLLPTLPAPSGTTLLERMNERMHDLRTLRIEEALGPAQPPTRTRYDIQAPDRLSYEVAGSSALVWIGGTRYLRDSPDATWRREETGISLPVPRFVWDPPAVEALVAPRLVGVEEVDSVPTQVLAFYGENGSIPTWFRAWVDGSGLAHRLEMYAQGHFMTHRYRDFDAPIAVEPPI